MPRILRGSLVLADIRRQPGRLIRQLLFSLTLHAYLLKVHNIIPNLQLNAWYLDNSKIVGTLNDMSQTIQMFVDVGPEYSLHL